MRSIGAFGLHEVLTGYFKQAFFTVVPAVSSRVQILLPVDDGKFVQCFVQKLFLGACFQSFQITNDGMLDNVGKGKADKSIIGISAGSVETVGVVEVVATLGGGALLHDFPETLGVACNGRVESWVGVGSKVDQRSNGTPGCTVGSRRTCIQVGDINGFAVSVRVSLGGTAVDMNLPARIVLVMAHSGALGTEWCAVSVEFDAAFVKEMGKDFLAVV